MLTSPNLEAIGIEYYDDIFDKAARCLDDQLVNLCRLWWRDFHVKNLLGLDEFWCLLLRVVRVSHYVFLRAFPVQIQVISGRHLAYALKNLGQESFTHLEGTLREQLDEVWVIHDDCETFKGQQAPPGQVHLRFFTLLGKDRLSLRQDKVHQVDSNTQVINDQDT
jgi:hypothetical protein